MVYKMKGLVMEMDVCKLLYQSVYLTMQTQLTESVVHEVGTEVAEDDVIAFYGHMVYRLAFAKLQNQHDAEDIFQEVFFRYVRRAPQFASKEHEKAWFLRTTINCCKTWWGSAWYRRTTGLSELEDCTVTYENEDVQMLADVLRQLPEKYRLVLHLYYYEGLNAKEIGRLKSIPAGTVRMQLSRARALLKARLLQEDEAAFAEEGISYDKA